MNLKIEFLFFWNGSILNLNRVDANNEGNNIFLYKEGGDGQQIIPIRFALRIKKNLGPYKLYYKYKDKNSNILSLKFKGFLISIYRSLYI